MVVVWGLGSHGKSGFGGPTLVVLAFCCIIRISGLLWIFSPLPSSDLSSLLRTSSLLSLGFVAGYIDYLLEVVW